MIVVVPGFGLGRNKTRLTGRLAFFKAYRASRCLRRFSWAYRASRYLRPIFHGPFGLSLVEAHWVGRLRLPIARRLIRFRIIPAFQRSGGRPTGLRSLTYCLVKEG